MTAILELHCYENDNRVFTFDMTQENDQELFLDWLQILVDNDEEFELEYKKQ